MAALISRYDRNALAGVNKGAPFVGGAPSQQPGSRQALAIETS
jgi:hypothetical protein